jgi:glycerol-3-phosphate cytidylyltransferase
MLDKIKKLKEEGKIIGFTASTADLGHSGLLIMLEELKSSCDYVVFGLLSDPTNDRPEIKNKPVESLFERWIRMSSIKYIDMIIPFSTEEDLENMIKIIKPNIRFVGEEYKGTKHTGWNIENVKIIYNKREHNYSTTRLRNRIMNSKGNNISVEDKIIFENNKNKEKTEKIKI